MKLHNHVFTTSHIIGTTKLLSCFFSGRRQKGTRARTLNNEKRKGGLSCRSPVHVPICQFGSWLLGFDGLCALTRLLVYSESGLIRFLYERNFNHEWVKSFHDPGGGKAKCFGLALQQMQN